MYQINNPNQEWDTDLHHELMSDKRIHSSKEAKHIRDKLANAGALPHLDNHFDWAMLCIAYCFAKGWAYKTSDLISPTDTKGTEIPSFGTCFQQDARLWLVILSDALFHNNPKKTVSKDDLYDFIEKLWHTGAVRLDEFWQRCRNFKPDDELAQRQEFLDELTQLAIKNAGLGVGNKEQYHRHSTIETPDLTEKMVKILQNDLKKGVNHAELVGNGVRYDFYRIQFANHVDWDRIQEPFCSAMSLPENAVLADRDTECGLPHAYRVKILRESSQWQKLEKTDLQQAIQSYSGHFRLPVCLGTDETGQPVFADLTEARHVLVGGTTGAGKSVMVRTLLHSLFELVQPEKAQIAIFDSAGDYVVFKDKPNLWQNEIKGKRDEVCDHLCEWVEEMQRRLALLQTHGVADITGLPENIRPPYWIALVEELAALLDTDKRAEQPLIQLLQEGRKTGIHLIMATQEPDSQTFSSRLRANIPSRIAMRVSKATSSTMILGETGAENLQGKGDHYVKWNGSEKQFLHGYNM